MKQNMCYAFTVKHKSCAGNEWVRERQHLTTNASNPYEEAGRIAAGSMLVTKNGVQVTFNGLMDLNDKDRTVTPMSPFVLTIERKAQ